MAHHHAVHVRKARFQRIGNDLASRRRLAGTGGELTAQLENCAVARIERIGRFAKPVLDIGYWPSGRTTPLIVRGPSRFATRPRVPARTSSREQC